jgi:hypothetical protein
LLCCVPDLRDEFISLYKLGDGEMPRLVSWGRLSFTILIADVRDAGGGIPGERVEEFR